MKRHNEAQELAPHDILAAPSSAKCTAPTASNVYLDMTAKPEGFVEKRFPASMPPV